MTFLDLAGPQATLGFHSITHLISNSFDPVLTDSGVSILPTATFETCPEDLDVLFVPGGFGTNRALQQEKLLRFLAGAGKRARFITSVCSGSVLLAAAGLLDGYRAATHWAVYGQLETFPNVTGVHERVVIDRNRFTGGGVTAGIDFGLTLLAALRGEAIAKMTQLMMEYDPKPPFNTGTPAKAGPQVTAMAEAAMQVSLDEGLTIVRELTESRMQPLPRTSPRTRTAQQISPQKGKHYVESIRSHRRLRRAPCSRNYALSLYDGLGFRGSSYRS